MLSMPDKRLHHMISQQIVETVPTASMQINYEVSVSSMEDGRARLTPTVWAARNARSRYHLRFWLSQHQFPDVCRCEQRFVKKMISSISVATDPAARSVSTAAARARTRCRTLRDLRQQPTPRSTQHAATGSRPSHAGAWRRSGR